MILRVSTGVFAAALACVSFTPASAGIFERIFGGFRRAAEAPANLRAFADPFAGMRNVTPQPAEASPAAGYCVRISDGFYFPVRAHAGVSAAEACHALCPAGETRLYYGGSIDNAVTSDGNRYADLDTAFLYRKQLIAASTCNGRNHFGLAHIDVNTDPTLRPGDIVATKTGLMAFTGMKNKVANLTPLDDYRGTPKSTREKLSDVKIMPPNPGAPLVAPVTMAPTARVRGDNRSAQLSR